MNIASRRLTTALVLAAGTLAACGSDAVSQSQGTPTSTAPTVAPTVAAPAPTVAAAAPTAAASAVVKTLVTSAGTVVAAVSNGMTLYTFDSDTAGSGMTTCNSGCSDRWPPLTVSAGTTPTPASGVSGRLSTIVRQDGRVQVTLNGRALYFFSGDSKVGDTNGHYPGWSLSVP